MDAVIQRQLDQIGDLALVVNDQADHIRQLTRSRDTARQLAQNLDDEAQRIHRAILALAWMPYGGTQWVRRKDVLAIIEGGTAQLIGPGDDV